MIKNKNKNKVPSENILLNEVGLLLSEKRTYFSVLRTGIAVTTLPLSVAVFLIATRDLHSIFDNSMYFSIAMMVLTLTTLGGVAMAIFASRRVSKIYNTVNKIGSENKRVEDIIV